MSAGPYAGLDRYEARKRIVAELEGQRRLVASKTTHTPSASATAARPWSSRAFPPSGSSRFKPLADKAIAAVRRRPHPLHARAISQDLRRVDAQHSRLVHLAPALVGPSHSRVALRRMRQDDGRARNARRPAQHCGSTGDHAGDRRARHVVLLRPAAHFASSAGRDADARSRRLLSDAICSSPASTSSSSGWRA